MARFFFCAIPALIVGAGGLLLHPAIGALFAACVFGLGWSVTTARHDRGET